MHYSDHICAVLGSAQLSEAAVNTAKEHYGSNMQLEKTQISVYIQIKNLIVSWRPTDCVC